jgi:hypothetical protein
MLSFIGYCAYLIACLAVSCQENDRFTVGAPSVRITYLPCSAITQFRARRRNVVLHPVASIASNRPAHPILGQIQTYVYDVIHERMLRVGVDLASDGVGVVCWGIVGVGHAEYPVLGIRRRPCRLVLSSIIANEKTRWQQYHLPRWRPLWNNLRGPPTRLGRTKMCRQARFCSRMN